MSKTSIWRQLSGTDINNETKKTNKFKSTTKPSSSASSKIRHRKAKQQQLSSSSPEDNDDVTGTEINQLSNNNSTPTGNNSSTDDKHQSNRSSILSTLPSVAYPIKQQQPVLFCIDPKDTHTPKTQNTTTTVNTNNEGGHADSLPLLDTPRITINPPSNQGSPETSRRQHVQRI